MPIEIREVIIKAHLDKSKSNEPSDANMSAEKIEAIKEEIIEEVMEKIEDKFRTKYNR